MCVSISNYKPTKPQENILKYSDIELNKLTHKHKSQTKRYGSAYEIYTYYSELNLNQHNFESILKNNNVYMQGYFIEYKKSLLKFNNNKKVYKYICILEYFID